MASSYPEHSRTDHDHEHHEPPCRDCDLVGLDDLNCESQGIADQAKYIADHATALTTRRGQYDTTRTDYTTKRGTATTDVAGIHKDLRQVREQLRCQLPSETLECLDEAWIEVAGQLERCGEPHGGCCVEECDFDRECEGYDDDDLHELTARIARIDRAVTAAEACFDTLTGEPDALVKRVATLRTDVDSLLHRGLRPEDARSPARLRDLALALASVRRHLVGLPPRARLLRLPVPGADVLDHGAAGAGHPDREAGRAAMPPGQRRQVLRRLCAPTWWKRSWRSAPGTATTSGTSTTSRPASPAAGATADPGAAPARSPRWWSWWRPNRTTTAMKRPGPRVTLAAGPARRGSRPGQRSAVTAR